MNRVVSPGKPRPSAIYALILNNNATGNCVWLSGRRCGAKNGDPGRFGVMAVRQAIDLACFPGAGKPVRSIGVRPPGFAASSWPRTLRPSSPGCKAVPFIRPRWNAPFRPHARRKALSAAFPASAIRITSSACSSVHDQTRHRVKKLAYNREDSNLYRKLAKGDMRCH